MEFLPRSACLGSSSSRRRACPFPVPGDLLVLGRRDRRGGAGIAAEGGAGRSCARAPRRDPGGGLRRGQRAVRARAGGVPRALLGVLTRFGVPRSSHRQPCRLAGPAAGRVGVAVARCTPGVRVGATAASGLAAMPFAAVPPRPRRRATRSSSAATSSSATWRGRPRWRSSPGTGGLALAIGAFVVLALIGAAGWRHFAIAGEARRPASLPGPRWPADLPADCPSWRRGRRRPARPASRCRWFASRRA